LIETTIIIPVFNAREHTEKCLDSLARFTDSPHKIIVVDNGSTDGTIELLKNYPAITVLKSPKNVGFAGACNIGLEATDSPFVALANNDLIFTPGWLRSLIATANLNKRIGLVGPLTNAAAGLHVEPFTPYASTAEMITLAASLKEKNAGLVHEVPFLIFFCVLIKREVISALGPLDESFGLGGCDDIDYSFRAAAAGYCCALDRSVFIHHACSRTYQANNLDLKHLLLEARERFKKKWGPLAP
jgi:GT2 family glycosyltransferase